MRTFGILAAVAAACLSLAAPAQAQEIRGLRLGMTKAEVSARFGQPVEIEPGEGEEVFWHLSDSEIMASFCGDRLNGAIEKLGDSLGVFTEAVKGAEARWGRAAYKVEHQRMSGAVLASIEASWQVDGVTWAFSFWKADGQDQEVNRRFYRACGAAI